jgi:transcriptional regulator with XRE-family HTH domain
MKKDEKQYLKLLGERIAEKRHAKGFSVQDFADKVGIARAHVYRIENGEHSPSITILRKIAKELGIVLSEIIKD